MEILYFERKSHCGEYGKIPSWSSREIDEAIRSCSDEDTGVRDTELLGGLRGDIEMSEERMSPEDSSNLIWSFSKSVSLVVVSFGMFLFLIAKAGLI